MFGKTKRAGGKKKTDYVLKARIITGVLSAALIAFISSYAFGHTYTNKYYYLYNLVASFCIFLIIIFIHMNYTEAGRKIQEKEKKYSIIFNNIDDIMVLRSVDSGWKVGRILDVNDAAVKFFGYEREEMMNMPPEAFVHPNLANKARTIFEKIEESWSKSFEMIFVAKDGRTVPVEVNSRVFMIDGERVLVSWARDLSERKEAQNSMRDAERSYRNLLEGLPDGVLIQHFPEGESIIELANKSAASILGFSSKEELKGKDFLSFLTKEAAADAITRRDRILAGGSVPLVERTIRTKEGIERTLEIRSISYELEAEDRYISIIRDITDKRETEKRLMENDRQLKRLLDFLPDSVLIYDWEKYLYSNESGAELLGEMSPGDVEGKSIYTYVDPDHFEDMEKRLHQLEKPNTDVPMIEQRIIRQDKSEVFVETKTISFPFSGKNSFVSIARDITDRLMLEQEKKKSAERYRQLIENFPDAVFVYDYENYMLANFAAAKLLGLGDPSSIVGRSAMYFFDEARKKFLHERLSRIAGGEDVLPVIGDEIFTEAGDRVPVEIKTIKFPYSDGLAFLSVIRDVSAKKRNEALRRKVERQLEYERMRTEYFANISHEFRTPLHAISGTIQLMEMKNSKISEEMPEFSVKNRRHLQIMKQNNNRLIKLVNNLIDINKIEAGFYMVNKKNWDMAEVIRNIVVSVMQLAKSEGIEISYRTECAPLVVSCDVEKIERIMLNLISNAIKFTSSGGSIKITAWKADGRLFVSVEDTGTGIDEKQLDRIFDRFNQAEDVFTSSNEGSGIGLSLVKGFVKMHGGSIEVRSEMGKGSCFTFEIPMRVEKDQNGEPLPVKEYDDFIYGRKIEVEFSDVKKRLYEVF